MRDSHKKPCAVAGFRIVAGRAAVHKALQDRHAFLDDVVVRLAREVGHHSDAARVVLVFSPVKALLYVFAVHLLFLEIIQLLPISPSCEAGLFRIREAARHGTRRAGAPLLLRWATAPRMSSEL